MGIFDKNKKNVNPNMDLVGPAPEDMSSEINFNEEAKRIQKVVETIVSRNAAKNKAKLAFASQTSNLVDEETTSEIVHNIYSQMKNAVEHTLGSYGEHSLLMPLENQFTFIYDTKDGFSALNEMRYNNSIANFVYIAIKDIANHMNSHVGDSTTSGLPIGYHLYTTIFDKYKKSGVKKEITSAGITNILKEIEKVFNEEVFDVEKDTKYVKLLNLNSAEEKEKRVDIFKKIGWTSSNGNGEMAARIADLYSDKTADYDSFVSLELSYRIGEEDQIIKEKGFEIENGILKHFANNADGASVTFEHPRIIMFNGPLMHKDKDVLRRIITGITLGVVDGVRLYKEEDTRPLIIIADGFEPQVEAMCVRFSKGSEFSIRKKVIEEGKEVIKEIPQYARIALMRLDNKYEDNKEIFDDLKIALGCEEFDTLNGKLTINVDLTKLDVFKQVIMDKTGACEKFFGTTTRSRFTGGAGHESKKEERIKLIEDKFKSYFGDEKLKPSKAVANYLRKRISMLKADTGRVIIGGPTVKEKLSKYEVYDDVTRAIRSAITSGGVMISGNLSVTHFIKYEKDRIIEKIVNSLVEKKMNVCTGGRREKITELVTTILDIVRESFEQSYKRALYNAIGDIDKVNEIYDNCLDDPEYPKVYNILTDDYESFKDFDNCNLLVPKNTDKELMYIVFATDSILLRSVKILATAPLDVDADKIRSTFLASLDD